ncbi:signal peptidase II [Truepera radiovictrix]|uniref:Lipoprotein signal peptidase n=1 Tax=Truepera radiovictrix (strain DSM 17093 / CIP 108686 / LMG 22925 / RQ-24) TaxID=649638 RepID=D7CRN4_TRURR|nr:signal peptidase II [Truepera radiovictrix]ADI13524.1 lipoprotein signal peptidase [Truepera radiovictrix DSM 17093]WMT57914.1 signal peptidase II [Truepera radiovictrix]
MYLLVAAALVALDQLTKVWAANTFPLGGPGVPIGLGFHFTYTRNIGAAFGILQHGPTTTLLLGVLSAAVSLALLIYLLRRAPTLSRLQLSAFTLILAGAVGNMIDRFYLGYVRDFIHFHLPNFNFPVFNVADMCVVIGAGLLILASLTEGSHEGQPRAAPPDELGGTRPEADR